MVGKLKKDRFKVAGKYLKSRLIVGTGKYNNFLETAQAIKASGADMVTVDVRRINITDKNKPLLTDFVNPKKIICGGLLFIETNSQIEVFMISVLSNYFSNDASNCLTDFLYNYANSKKISYINWQRSSNSKVSIFKKKWKSEEINIPHIHYYNNNRELNNITKDFLIENFHDLYIYPFDKIKL